jgi:hypothetical protein
LITKEEIVAELHRELEKPNDTIVIASMTDKINRFDKDVEQFSEALLRDSHPVRTMTPDLPFYINDRDHRQKRAEIRQSKG